MKELASKYIRTDLASECLPEEEAISQRGVEYREGQENGIGVSTLKITTDEGERIIGKPKGEYITIQVGKIWLADDELVSRTAELLAHKIRSLIDGVTADKQPSVLVIGLGNRYITSDAIGPLSVKDLTVTRHIREYDENLYRAIDSLCISAFTPGVVGQTGIETIDLIKGAVKTTAPAVVIAIDALASRSVDRLATTVQLSDTGITPGSGIGNTRRAVDKNELGVPVISIGVPTVVDSSTLIMDLLEQSGIEGLPSDLERRLENGRSFFVTLKDSDIAVSEISSLISMALNSALSADYE